MKRACLGGLLGVVLAAQLARADDPPYVPPAFLATTPPLPPTQQTGEVLRLGLRDALELAVKNNFDVILEKKTAQATDLGITVAKGAFEPVITASYTHSDDDSPPVTFQEGQAGQILTYIRDAWSIDAVKTFATGTRIAVGVQSGRTQSSSGTAVEPLNYRSQAQISVTQPVLRGFSRDLEVQQIDVIRARIASGKERAQLAVTLAGLVERTEAAYWEVLRALYRYDVSKRSAEAADQQLALTQRQIDAGTLAPSDLIGAQSTLAQRQLEVLQADEQIRAASDLLRAVLNLPREQWARPILPTDVPQFAPTTTTDDQALDLAIHSRPELAQMDLDLESARLAIRKAENDKLPLLDLGVTGAVIGQDNTYPGSLGGLGDFDAKGWSVFFNFAWTPLNRAPKALAAIAAVQRDATAVRREQLVQQVWLEVRDALRSQGAASRQIAAAAKFRALAEQSLEIEQRKFLNGSSENQFVALRQDAVAQAQLSELDALVAYNRASSTLLRTTGQLLKARSLELSSR